jgi:hypothetical protein
VILHSCERKNVFRGKLASWNLEFCSSCVVLLRNVQVPRRNSDSHLVFRDPTQLRNVLVTVAVLLAFQQVLGATDQEVEDAYSDFENATKAILQETADMRDYYMANSSENVDFIIRDGKLALDFKIAETNQLIQKMAARTDGYEYIDATKCFLGTTLEMYVDDALDRLEFCLYDLRYITAYNMVFAKWFDIYRLGNDYLTCTQKAIEDCKGDEACNDQIIAEIAEKKEAAASSLNLLAVEMHNYVDSVPVNCKDRILMDVFSFASDYVEYVSACIDSNISPSLPRICTVWKK